MFRFVLRYMGTPAFCVYAGKGAGRRLFQTGKTAGGPPAVFPVRLAKPKRRRVWNHRDGVRDDWEDP